MVSRWKEYKQATDPYLPQVKAIIGTVLICEAPIEDDAQRNTDLMMLKADGLRIAVRLREWWYWNNKPKWRDEFTIRYSLPSGAQTEFSKIMDDGWGDYMFYGFRHRIPNKLAAWGILDLRIFRKYVNIVRTTTGRIPAVERRNGDGSSTFLAFKWRALPDAAIVKCWPACISWEHKTAGFDIRNAVQQSLMFDSHA